MNVAKTTALRTSSDADNAISITLRGELDSAFCRSRRKIESHERPAEIDQLHQQCSRFDRHAGPARQLGDDSLGRSNDGLPPERTTFGPLMLELTQRFFPQRHRRLGHAELNLRLGEIHQRGVEFRPREDFAIRDLLQTRDRSLVNFDHLLFAALPQPSFIEFVLHLQLQLGADAHIDRAKHLSAVDVLSRSRPVHIRRPPHDSRERRSNLRGRASIRHHAAIHRHSPHPIHATSFDDFNTQPLGLLVIQFDDSRSRLSRRRRVNHLLVLIRFVGLVMQQLQPERRAAQHTQRDHPLQHARQRTPHPSHERDFTKRTTSFTVHRLV